MRHAITMVGTLLAVLAVNASTAPQALALPELLGQAAEAEYTTKSTTSTTMWESTKEEQITCGEVVGDGVQETDSLGTFHGHFNSCKASGFACDTTGEASGVILFSGTKHFVLYKLGAGPELGVAILFLPDDTTVKCSMLVTIKIRGTFLCPVAEPLTASPTHNFVCSGSKGIPAQTTWWNDNDEEQHAKLEMSKNGGSLVEAMLFGSGTITYATAVAFMNE